MIRCSLCGASYQRKKRYGYNLYDWKCWNYLYSSKSERCKTVGLSESILIEKTKEALEVDELTSKLVKDKIKVIFAHPNRVLELIFNSGYKVKVEARKKGILVFLIASQSVYVCLLLRQFHKVELKLYN